MFCKSKLYVWQKEVIELIDKNSKSKDIFIIAPTGSGKSLVAYYYLDLYGKLKNRRRKRIYTVPTKSLALDKYEEIAEIVGKDNVGIATGEVKYNIDAAVLVCTHEIYANRYAGKGYKTVIDEFHIISNQTDRAKIYLNSLNKKDAYLFLTGTFSVNKEEFLQYLSKYTGKEIILYETDFRKAELEYLEPTTINKFINRVVEKDWIAAIVTFSKRRLKQIADTILGQVKQTTDIDKSLLSLIKNETLQTYLKYGIALYHSSLPFTYKKIIQQLTKNKKLRFIVTTDAISVGLNLPIDIILFTTLRKFDKTYRRLHKSEFIQIANRAGRFGKGYITILDRPDNKEDYYALQNELIEPFKIEPTLRQSEIIHKTFDELLQDIITYTYPKQSIKIDTIQPKLQDLYISLSSIYLILSDLQFNEKIMQLLYTAPELDETYNLLSINNKTIMHYYSLMQNLVEKDIVNINALYFKSDKQFYKTLIDILVQYAMNKDAFYIKLENEVNKSGFEEMNKLFLLHKLFSILYELEDSPALRKIREYDSYLTKMIT